MTPEEYAANIAQALDVQDQNVRVKAAMAAGTHPHPSLIETLVRRCGVEPDFFVRETLSWALTRHNADEVLPRVQRELTSKNIQARTQAIHTLSKIGDQRAWPWITSDFLHDDDIDLARTAWRAAAALVPEGQEAALASELVKELGRGDEGVRMALSIAMLELGEPSIPIVQQAIKSPDEAVSEHARVTELMRTRPELAFGSAVEEAKRIVALGGQL